MADTRRYLSNQPLDLEQVLQETQHRWLRPAEICEILRNHHKFYLTPEPPVRPPGGSLFLFDRKVLRYFRKDGHQWRKKKDGKTVKEAHEKLKAGSVDVLHCYYAHGENNENFQRRSYWMLEEKLEHIVLVHYREVIESYRVGASRLQPIHPGQLLENPSSSPCFVSGLIVQESHTSSPSSVDWKEQALSSELYTGDSKGNEVNPLLVPASGHFLPITSSFSTEKPTGLVEFSRDNFQLNPQFGSFVSIDAQSSDRNLNVTLQKKFYSGYLNVADLLSSKLTYARLDGGRAVKDVANSRNRLTITSGEVLEENIHLAPAQIQNISSSQTVVTPDAAVQNSSLEGRLNSDEAGSLKKLDSFGRWMDREIAVDGNESLLASDSGNYWNTLDNGDKEVARLSCHMQLDTNSLGPFLSQEQLFSISDFAPDWAYSGVETKVLIIGTFLGHGKHPTSQKWSCMFGEVEVSAELLTQSIIRCEVPSHSPGRVPFYVTCSNRLACSEVREFEYREKSSELALALRPSDEVRLQVRLAKLLYSGLNKKFLDCSSTECERGKLKTLLCSLKCNIGNASESLEDLLAIIEGNHINFRDTLIQSFMKDKFYEWLVSRAHEEDKGPNILDDEGQGVIHLVASLGYEWGLVLLTAAGINPNLRDARGRTALHWAAHYGREDMVIALVKLGVAVCAVDDPTAAFPGGQTAADLASSGGHKGVAGYLAESELTAHLQSLAINNNALDSICAGLEAEKAFESAAQEVVPLNGTIHDDISLKGSLASVRKSAHAAALIQAAFRARSFHQRQLRESRNDVSEASVDLVALGSLNKVQKVNHFEDYLHPAAIKIQQKYRGWKGRREFLKIRNRIVKIQAHVRGHQVRKQYKKFVWSVSIVEKAILRWRRKKPGLRGFQPEKTSQKELPEFEKNDEYEYLSIGRKQKFAGVQKALARVQSMVRHPEARDQYMRLVAKFDSFKLDDGGSSI
ncbi:calmodulin-binding transcription activator 3-like isoform X1 [Nicotiana sylvestris]|uniref:Calmodulin-binding transcription activator 1-like isoform X1 n=2 Tax=Nicotiana sylvestris TaxID=4096 RepID=A0A1U7XM11_NICSY|nr:PREDICTED: calmodulin-binding transcription activator 1-like isoform X1 [Nicotiana sylvestris]